MPDIMMDLLGSMLPAPEYATKEYVQARIAEAMNTAGSGPSVVLEPATFTANGSYQPDPGKAWDDVVVNVSGGGGGTTIQSGYFTPTDAASSYSVVVDDAIASNPFVAIFSIDAETTPTNLGLVEAVYFVPNPSATIPSYSPQFALLSNNSEFIHTRGGSVSSGSWNPSTKTLTMSARGGSNFYAGSQYSYAIIPLSALVSVYR